MLIVIQRVSKAHVEVDEQLVAAINHGMLVFCGFSPQDTVQNLDAMLSKCLRYRMFSDEKGAMNRSLQETNGGLLLVPQFTLLADTGRGLRPGFSYAATPELGEQLFNTLVSKAKNLHPVVASGKFSVHMQVHLCNDGPVTFTMEF